MAHACLMRMIAKLWLEIVQANLATDAKLASAQKASQNASKTRTLVLWDCRSVASIMEYACRTLRRAMILFRCRKAYLLCPARVAYAHRQKTSMFVTLVMG